MYSDESESTKPALVLIGGWISEVDLWAELSVQWKAILNQYGVEYFHAHSFRNARDPKYRHLSKHDREHFLISLLMLIKRYAKFGQVAWAKPGVYNYFTTKEFRARHGSVYATLVGQAFALAGIHVTYDCKREQTVSFFLESGHKHAKEALQFVDQYKVLSTAPPKDVEIVGTVGNSGLAFSPFKVGAFGFGSKREMMPLQAADILAYCSLCLRKNSKDPYARALLSAIGLPIFVRCLDKEAILGMVELLNRTDREEVKIQHNRRRQIKQLKALGLPFEVLPDRLSVQIPDDPDLERKVREIIDE